MKKDVELIIIKPLETENERITCAKIMSSSEPWITMKRDFEKSMKLLNSTDREIYVAVNSTELVGFVSIAMSSAFRGYIQTLAVAEDYRSLGFGARLLEFAETRIFKDSPNVFICVSSYNPRAQIFYKKMGYETIGELKDYVVAGKSEILLRKTIGSMNDFQASTTTNNHGN